MNSPLLIMTVERGDDYFDLTIILYRITVLECNDSVYVDRDIQYHSRTGPANLSSPRRTNQILSIPLRRLPRDGSQGQALRLLAGNVGSMHRSARPVRLTSFAEKLAKSGFGATWVASGSSTRAAY